MVAINCKEIKEKWLVECKAEISKMEIKPSLLIIKANDNPSSEKYVKNKIKTCEDCGIKTTLVEFGKDKTTKDLVNFIQFSQGLYSAVIVQSPLYSHLDEHLITNMVNPFKDCDGLTEANIGKLFSNKPMLTPATPQGVIDMFDEIGYDLTGKEVLVIGRSLLFGKTFAELCNQKNATTTLAHSKSNLIEITFLKHYDVIVSAIGKPKFLSGFEADILVDVGINFDENGKMCGDFDLDGCECKMYTPVPNGVGQLTQAAVVKNIVKCHKLQGRG